MTDREIAERGTLTMPLGNVSGMEVRTGGNTHAFEGAVVGALGGAGLAALLAATSAKPECKGLGCALEGDAVSIGTSVVALLGGIAGGALGAAVGACIETDVWTPAQMRTTAHLELRPTPNGLGARLSFSLR